MGTWFVNSLYEIDELAKTQKYDCKIKHKQNKSKWNKLAGNW